MVGSGVTCSCADGYELEEDGKTCKVAGNKKKYTIIIIITIPVTCPVTFLINIHSAIPVWKTMV